MVASLRATRKKALAFGLQRRNDASVPGALKLRDGVPVGSIDRSIECYNSAAVSMRFDFKGGGDRNSRKSSDLLFFVQS